MPKEWTALYTKLKAYIDTVKQCQLSSSVNWKQCQLKWPNDGFTLVSFDVQTDIR